MPPTDPPTAAPTDGPTDGPTDPTDPATTRDPNNNCPGGNLEACISLCPEEDADIYQVPNFIMGHQSLDLELKTPNVSSPQACVHDCMENC